jgi:hypothetical protein
VVAVPAEKSVLVAIIDVAAKHPRPSPGPSRSLCRFGGLLGALSLTM